jgi:hypothetical protein
VRPRRVTARRDSAPWPRALVGACAHWPRRGAGAGSGSPPGGLRELEGRRGRSGARRRLPMRAEAGLPSGLARRGGGRCRRLQGRD